MRKLVFLFIVSIFLPFFSTAQEDLGKKSNIKVTQISPKIYMLKARGGNIGLSIGEDGVFMIDDQFADLSEDILAEIKKFTDKPVKFLVNTHHHGDHTGGNVNMAKEGAIIFAQENVRERLLAHIEKSRKEGKKIEEEILPIITFPEDISFHFNGEEIKVFYVGNAHTDGDAMVYFTQSNVLHTGDAFFAKRYPYIDLNSGGSVEGYIEALDKVYKMINDDTKIIPGHGDVAERKDLFYTKNMLNRILKQVSVHHYEELSLQEIQNIPEITQAYDEKGFGDYFITRERILEIVYNEVSKQ